MDTGLYGTGYDPIVSQNLIRFDLDDRCKGDVNQDDFP